MVSPNRRRKNRRPTPMKKGHVPANQPPIETVIERVGARGDGVAQAAIKIGWEVRERPLFVPYTLPGERLVVQPERDRGEGIVARPVELLEASADRVDPPCPHFGACGGCLLQHWADAPYIDWKREQVRLQLARVGLDAVEVTEARRSPPGSRRRVDWAARRLKGRVVLGFHERDGARIEGIEQCAVLRPEIEALIAPCRTLLADLLAEGGEARIEAAATETGIDLLLSLPAAPDLDGRERLAGFAAERDLARMTLRVGKDPMLEPVAVARQPVLTFDGIGVTPAPGGFLQATEQGEQAMRAVLAEALAEATPGLRIDLFAGLGTLTLPMRGDGPVRAIDGDPAAIGALRAAANAARLGPRIETLVQDLFAEPVTADELAGASLLVFDPPRAGARAQAPEIAASGVPLVVAVSCNPATFARDARVLVDGGYRLRRVTPIDQFLWSPHIELVGIFDRPEG